MTKISGDESNCSPGWSGSEADGAVKRVDDGLVGGDAVEAGCADGGSGEGMDVGAPQRSEAVCADIRQMPGCCEARIAILTGLGNEKIAPSAGKRRSKPVAHGSEALTRVALLASRHTCPLVACRT